jgi:hypothetical protein
MPFKFFKTFEHDSIANNSTIGNSWTAEDNYIIKRIYIIRKDGASLTKSTFYFKIGDRVFTREIVPANIFRERADISPELNIPFNKSEKLDYNFNNQEGTTISIFVVFEVHTA